MGEFSAKLFKSFTSFCSKSSSLVTEITESKEDCGWGKQQELSWQPRNRRHEWEKTGDDGWESVCLQLRIFSRVLLKKDPKDNLTSGVW